MVTRSLSVSCALESALFTLVSLTPRTTRLTICNAEAGSTGFDRPEAGGLGSLQHATHDPLTQVVSGTDREPQWENG